MTTKPVYINKLRNELQLSRTKVAEICGYSTNEAVRRCEENPTRNVWNKYEKAARRYYMENTNRTAILTVQGSAKLLIAVHDQLRVAEGVTESELFYDDGNLA